MDLKGQNWSKGQQELQHELVDCFNKMLKIMKEREQNYFYLLDFIKKYMQSLQSETQKITIISIQLNRLIKSQSELIRQQEVLINQQRNSIIKNKKQNLKNNYRLITRLSLRIYQFFEVSLVKTKGTFFYSSIVNGEYKQFKNKVNQLVSGAYLSLIELVILILTYSKCKFDRQYNKLNYFLSLLQNGLQIQLKDFYSDIKNQNIKIQRQNNHRKSPQNKKTIKQKTKQKQRKSKGQKSNSKPDQIENQQLKESKNIFFNKILKVYSIIQPSKIQFLEDYMYDQNQQQNHKNKLLNILKLKNKDINEQIMGFYKKVENQSIKIQYQRQNKPIQFVFLDQEYQDEVNSQYEKTNYKINNYIRKRSKRSFASMHEKSESPQIKQKGQYIKEDKFIFSERQQKQQYKNNIGSGQQSIKKKKKQQYLKNTKQKKQKVYPNNNMHRRLKQFKQSDSIVKITQNQILIAKSPVLYQNQNLKSNLIVHPTSITRRNSLLQLNEDNLLDYQRIRIKTGRKILHKKQEKKSKIQEPINNKKYKLIQQTKQVQFLNSHNFKFKTYITKNIPFSNTTFIQNIHSQTNYYSQF